MRWIIGDIHGMYTPLDALLTEIARQDSRPRLLFCGDYVNRGPDSRRVVELLLTLTNAAFCRGNHDDTFNLLMTGESYVPVLELNIATTFEHFLQYGLDQTLESYGVDRRAVKATAYAPTTAGIHALLEPVPPAHRTFFDSLPAVLHEKEFFVAHAKWSPTIGSSHRVFDRELGQSSKARHDIIWGRFTSKELSQTKTWDRPGFFGHTPVSMYRSLSPMLPVEASQIVLLDTAAALHEDGRLTAWCYEETRYVQVERDGSVVV